MKKISITRHGLSTLCRLCLSSGVNMIDIFWFSNRLKVQVAEVIMECAPIQIARSDGMPNVICRLCYTQLEKIRQFQKQVVQSEKTLRQYVQQLHASDNETKPDCSIQKPSENSLIHNFNSNIFVKCESFELDDEFDMNATWQKTESTNFDLKNETENELSINSEIKVESIDDNLLIPIECADDTVGTSYRSDDGDISCEDPKINIGDNEFSETVDVNWKVNKLENFNLANKSNEEMSLNSEIKNESIDVNSLIPIVYINDTENAFSNDCEDTTIHIDHTLGTFACHRSRSPVVTEYSDNCNEENKIRLVNHETHKDVSKACDVCGKCFARLQDFKRHKSLHSGDKLYQCNVCNKQFTQSSNLYRHRRVHTGERPYQCDICNKRFSQSGSLNNHKLTHTGEKPYQCDVCNKRFNHLSHLIVHKRTHTGEKPYPCDVCNKHFAQLSTLNDHRLTHTGEKPYQCEICNNNFTKLSSLNIHKRTHTGEKPYQCDFCNKRFYHSSHLYSHKRTHTDEKPHHCDICEKSFKESATLKKHRRIHTGEKPHQCNVCNKIFNESDMLNHKCHTGEKPYQCTVCNKSFTQLRHLNTHKLTHS